MLTNSCHLPVSLIRRLISVNGGIFPLGDTIEMQAFLYKSLALSTVPAILMPIKSITTDEFDGHA